MYKGFLMDLDGVAYLGKEGIESCKEFVVKCQEKGIPFIFWFFVKWCW